MFGLITYYLPFRKIIGPSEKNLPRERKLSVRPAKGTQYYYLINFKYFLSISLRRHKGCEIYTELSLK